jgi:2-polyprenyl-3-methyl-5-hydroxy-6-metoxy-1,4-benzoquinol methylase
MAVGETGSVTRVARPPRAVAWVVLLAASAAVLAVGLFATALLVGNLGGFPVPRDGRFWLSLLAACVLTILSISLRSVRWIFLLRRAETRIPIRDAYIGYLSGLSLLFTPFLAGEIAVRASVNRARGAVPAETTVVVNVWERLLDLTALSLLAGFAGLATHAAAGWNLLLIGCAVGAFVTPLRRQALALVVKTADVLTRPFDAVTPPPADGLAQLRNWNAALIASLVAWICPAAGLWLIARSVASSIGPLEAMHTYGASATATVVTLAPGGILVAGRTMLASLAAHGFTEDGAVLTVLGTRLATAGLSVVLGVLFVALHLRSRSVDSSGHFDEIADAYDVQIPQSRRDALLRRKTDLMKSALDAERACLRGLDVGCGQGAYVARMRTLGFDVSGIDASAGQVRLAIRNLGDGSTVSGSVLAIPAADNAYDFVYIINVLHHLASVDEQRRAFAEMLRVIRPGGLLFVHEINTTNALFRFYMGYVFPSLNCIDEGIERWLLPRRLGEYTAAPVEGVAYFTFLPDFVPSFVVRLCAPLERFLERSAARIYSAHYMAVLRKR